MTNVETQPATGTCCNDLCRSVGPIAGRGLCKKCYYVLFKAIKAKKVESWKHAENLGLCGGVKRTPMQAAIDAALDRVTPAEKPTPVGETEAYYATFHSARVRDNRTSLGQLDAKGYPPRVTELFRECIAALKGNDWALEFGPAHVVYSDGNLDRGSILFCIGECCNADNYLDNCTIQEAAIISDCLAKLLLLSDDEREGTPFGETHP